jgi:hypothetical protein
MSLKLCDSTLVGTFFYFFLFSCNYPTKIPLKTQAFSTLLSFFRADSVENSWLDFSFFFSQLWYKFYVIGYKEFKFFQCHKLCVDENLKLKNAFSIFLKTFSLNFIKKIIFLKPTIK